MSRTAYILLAALMFLLRAELSAQTFEDEYPDKRMVAFGAKYRFPVFGLNLVGWFNRSIGVDAIVGYSSLDSPFGTTTLKQIAVAGRYRFNDYSIVRPYLGAGVAYWIEDYDDNAAISFFSSSTREQKTDLSIGYNIFVGIETLKPEFSRNVAADIEIGYNIFKFHSIRLSRFMYGAGIHYYF